MFMVGNSGFIGRNHNRVIMRKLFFVFLIQRYLLLFRLFFSRLPQLKIFHLCGINQSQILRTLSKFFVQFPSLSKVSSREPVHSQSEQKQAKPLRPTEPNQNKTNEKHHSPIWLIYTVLLERIITLWRFGDWQIIHFRNSAGFSLRGNWTLILKYRLIIGKSIKLFRFQIRKVNLFDSYCRFKKHCVAGL